MTDPLAGASPRFKARLAGVCALLEGLTSVIGQQFVLGRLVIPDNGAATAANILGNQPLFWFGFAASLIAVGLHIAWILLFHELFTPVNRSLSLLAVLVMLVGCSIQALTSLFYIAPLLVLESGSSLSGFTPEQVQALALLLLDLNAQAFKIYLVFFGLWCILTGCLIFRSTFLPRILGVLLVIDGFGWVTYLVPPLAQYLFPFIAAASGLAELPLALWLIVMGVNAQRWKEQASAVREWRS